MITIPSAGDGVPGGAPARAPHVLAIPFPAQGHLLPMLDFVQSLAGGGIGVTVAVTTANAPLLADLLSRNPAVELLSVPFPAADPSAVPAGVESARGLPPSAIPGFIHALAGLHPALAAWAKPHPAPPTAIVADIFCGWAQPLAAELGIKNFAFSPSGVLGTAVLHSLFIRMPETSSDEEDTVAFPSLPNSPEFKWKEISRLYRGLVAGDPLSESMKKNFAWNLDSHGFILNSFRELEAAYVDHPLEDLGNKKLWLVGPLAAAAGGGRGGAATMSAADVSSWLDKFGHGEVVYVSFGSQANLGAASAATLAAALEECGAPFVWAVAGGAALPDGFAAGERGIVIRGWAPQVEILSHPAVGWFVTHCGWNSVLEAVAAGVAMLAWPMASDQFVNARLLVGEAGLALPACGDGGVVEALRRAVGKDGEEVRERARRAAAAAKAAVDEGGSSRADADELVQELWALAAA